MSTHPEEAQIEEEESKHSVAMNPRPEEVQKVTESKHSNPREESPAKEQHCMEVEETTSEQEASKSEEEEQRKMPEEAAETEMEAEAEAEEEEDKEEEDSGRERLKRHRVEMAGRVWIPEIWGQETLLKDWSDCSAFDRSLVPDGLNSARTALVEERQQTSSGAGIENRCS